MFLHMPDMQIWFNDTCMSAVDSKHAFILKEFVIESDMSPAQQPAAQPCGGWLSLSNQEHQPASA